MSSTGTITDFQQPTNPSAPQGDSEHMQGYSYESFCVNEALYCPKVVDQERVDAIE
jgi:hypothetical protein